MKAAFATKCAATRARAITAITALIVADDGDDALPGTLSEQLIALAAGLHEVLATEADATLRQAVAALPALLHPAVLSAKIGPAGVALGDVLAFSLRGFMLKGGLGLRLGPVFALAWAAGALGRILERGSKPLLNRAAPGSTASWPKRDSEQLLMGETGAGWGATAAKTGTRLKLQHCLLPCADVADLGTCGWAIALMYRGPGVLTDTGSVDKKPLNALCQKHERMMKVFKEEAQQVRGRPRSEIDARVRGRALEASVAYDAGLPWWLAAAAVDSDASDSDSGSDPDDDFV